MKPIVHIIDDDQSMLKLLRALMESVKLDVKTYSSAQEFLSKEEGEIFGCILCDIRMPEISGLELQDKINKLGTNAPIIFLTGYADVSIAVESMKKGAFNFIEKPFNNQQLIECVQKAITQSMQLNKEQKTKAVNIKKYNSLTKREAEVFKFIALGEVNKVTAHKLGISVKTVEVHRSKIMSKFNATGLVDLIKINNSINGW